MIQGSPEWIEWRRKGIGASDIAAIIGVCKYSTPYRVWLEKTGRSIGFSGNYATVRGQELESKARARYELIALEDMPPRIATHPKYEIFRASLDGMSVDNRRILEVKVPGRESHESAVAGRVPDHYVPQVQWQLMVTGADECDYFSFCVDKDGAESHALVTVTQDIQLQGELAAKAQDFWSLVVSDTQPPLMESDDLVIDDGEVADICRVLVERKESLAKSIAEEMKARVIEIGGHARIRSGRALVTRSRLASGRYSYRLTVAKISESEGA